MVEFDMIKMKEFDTIDMFVGKFLEILLKLIVFGEIIDELKFVKKIYIYYCSIWVVFGFNIISFEDIVERLKVYEKKMVKKNLMINESLCM